MRAPRIMTRPVITVTPQTRIVEAANTMLRKHVSGLQVVDKAGRLVGIVSEGDFIRRSEIGTQRKRGRRLKLILGPGKSAADFVHEHGRKVAEVMTKAPLTITDGYGVGGNRATDGKEQRQAAAGDARRPSCRHRIARQPAAGGSEPRPRDSRSDRRR